MATVGVRMPPPASLQSVITSVAVQIQRQSGSDHFEISELYEFDSEIITHTDNITITEKSIYSGGRKIADLPDHEVKTALTPRQRHLIAAWIDSAQVRFCDLSSGQDLNAEVSGNELFVSGGRIYIRQESRLLEVGFTELPHTVLVKTRVGGNVLPNAAQVFEGVIIQNLLGAYYASLLPASGVCYQVRLKELDGYRVIEARAFRNVLIIVAAHGGTFDKFIYRFNEEFSDDDLRVISDVALTGINFVVLDSGVCLHLTDNDELEIFASRKGSAGIKVISDPAVRGDARLFHAGAQALIARGHKLCRLTMRQK